MLFLSVGCIGQNNSELQFNNEIINSNWSCEDSTQLSKYDIVVVSFNKDSITHSYLSFIEGYYANRCSYTAIFTESYFLLELGACLEKQSEINFIYGYILNDKLNILMTEFKIDSKNVIESKKGWISYERILD